VFVPARTFRSKLQGGLQQFIAGSIFVSAISPEAAGRAQTEVEEILRQRHRLAEGTPDDFNVRNLSEIASAQQEGARVMTSLLAGIALVSLVVGGIGIMNIMLVSVTERTREIGVRRALGARAKDILVQFLAESALVSLVGGAVGVALGFGIASAVSHFAQWPTLVGPEAIMIAFGFSAIVGIFFGFYPARTAARLDPIESLRYE
ncbi:MAG TPA: FtsX-like permease family protein, partial [Candidatus Eisenbacteria bacterium]|nr:FtsX-like permease family protein [Candidatus Eisenbacteria bacterium]